ncbi:MAG: UDP-N-acetylmuramate--L-alanine ligase [Planctomycetaceae bacterium]|nr:UDP-N-acetylmuramate--L-alanine ligase [Planctomycetaceae bacterium]
MDAARFSPPPPLSVRPVSPLPGSEPDRTSSVPRGTFRSRVGHSRHASVAASRWAPAMRVGSASRMVREPGGSVPTAHLVGVCGSGMQALAELLLGLGWQVSGSDRCVSKEAASTLERRGLRIHQGHKSTQLPHHADVLVYSQAIAPDNVERVRASHCGIPQLSYSQMLGRLMSERMGISIAGTHGKSTTTAMTASLLTSAGLAPSVVVGARLIDRDVGGWAGAGDLLVVESCEYRRSFLDLSPRYAVITGIESDHFDCYESLGEVTAAFAQFAASVDSSGVLLVAADCPAAVEVSGQATARVRTFGRRPEADWWAADVRRTVSGSRFELFFRGEFLTEITVPVPGRHNVDNALAAVAMACELGVDPQLVCEGLGGYAGIRRRFQRLGSWRGVAVVDDYAHHPTAVRATLETARETFGRRRLWCAFQPHQVSRTLALLDEFASSFQAADRVLLLPVFAAREDDRQAEAVSRELAKRIGRSGSGTACRFAPSLDRLVETLDHDTRPGDVLITMGAGDIDQVPHEFTR